MNKQMEKNHDMMEKVEVAVRRGNMVRPRSPHYTVAEVVEAIIEIREDSGEFNVVDNSCQTEETCIPFRELKAEMNILKGSHQAELNRFGSYIARLEKRLKVKEDEVQSVGRKLGKELKAEMNILKGSQQAELNRFGSYIARLEKRLKVKEDEVQSAERKLGNYKNICTHLLQMVHQAMMQNWPHQNLTPFNHPSDLDRCHPQSMFQFQKSPQIKAVIPRPSEKNEKLNTASDDYIEYMDSSKPVEMSSCRTLPSLIIKSLTEPNNFIGEPSESKSNKFQELKLDDFHETDLEKEHWNTFETKLISYGFMKDCVQEKHIVIPGLKTYLSHSHKTTEPSTFRSVAVLNDPADCKETVVKTLNILHGRFWGKGGATIDTLLKDEERSIRKEILEFPPDIVVLQKGGNDLDNKPFDMHVYKLFLPELLFPKLQSVEQSPGSMEDETSVCTTQNYFCPTCNNVIKESENVSNYGERSVRCDKYE
ncbi:unnamed protein product [Mytilus edulis]|uniref:Uncharacterized protein n=1 Tax=Mytilus edulis TaxID=6550 RepID=A0A8S3RBC5_MYTED|nr:unnamed protein product [Mytilus edulis]